LRIYKFAPMKTIPLIALVATLLTACHSNKQDLEVLVKVNTSLQHSIHIVTGENQVALERLNSAFAKDPNVVKPYKNAGDIATRQSDEMIHFIGDMKVELVKRIDKTMCMDKADTMLEHFDKKDERIKASYIMLEGTMQDMNGRTVCLGQELKSRLNDYRKKMLALCQFNRDTAIFHSELLTPDKYDAEIGQVEPWEVYTFKNLPLVADIVMLSKLELDIRNMESEFLNYFYYSIPITDSWREWNWHTFDSMKHSKPLR